MDELESYNCRVRRGFCGFMKQFFEADSSCREWHVRMADGNTRGMMMTEHVSNRGYKPSHVKLFIVVRSVASLTGAAVMRNDLRAKKYSVILFAYFLSELWGTVLDTWRNLLSWYTILMHKCCTTQSTPHPHFEYLFLGHSASFWQRHCRKFLQWH